MSADEGRDPDGIMSEHDVAEHVGIPPRDVKRAWREGRLRGARFGGRYRFRYGAVRAWLLGEEDRWEEKGRMARGSEKSVGSTPGTSIGTTPPSDASDDLALALQIADELKRPSGSSSSNGHARKSPANSSRRSATP